MTEEFDSTFSSPSSPDDYRNRAVALAQRLGRALEALGWRVATAESCTGGGIAAAITEVAGSSAWFEYGLVTYANSAKQSLLGVSPDMLEVEGAVSEAVVQQMARGALSLADADLAVAVSGVAGPGGGSPDKPVGTVWLGWSRSGEDGAESGARCFHFDGDRAAVRGQSVVAALEQLLALTELFPESRGTAESTV